MPALSRLGTGARPDRAAGGARRSGHIADAARTIAADPELHATALLAGVISEVPPDGVVADDEVTIHRADR